MESCSITVEAEFPDARSAIDGTRLLQGEERLCAVHVPTHEEVRQLKWLSENFIGRPLMALVGEKLQRPAFARGQPGRGGADPAAAAAPGGLPGGPGVHQGHA